MKEKKSYRLFELKEIISLPLYYDSNMIANTKIGSYIIYIDGETYIQEDIEEYEKFILIDTPLSFLTHNPNIFKVLI